jgi:hypothetical protein
MEELSWNLKLGTEEKDENLRIAGVPVEIRIQHYPNKV